MKTYLLHLLHWKMFLGFFYSLHRSFITPTAVVYTYDRNDVQHSQPLSALVSRKVFFCTDLLFGLSLKNKQPLMTLVLSSTLKLMLIQCTTYSDAISCLI
jgi:hypothetical protein